MIKYIDMHCDTFTVCHDNGLDLDGGSLQVNLTKLESSGCKAQCFAIFTEGKDAFEKFNVYLDYYKNALKHFESRIKSIDCTADFAVAERDGKIGCILTVENLGFLPSPDYVKNLKQAGVKMASLVWNYENKLAYPNLKFVGGIPDFSLREARGLKPLGREVAEMLDGNNIIVDISHISDGGADEILENRKIPVVASHSNTQSVLDVSRNLTDGQIKKIADCGGVIGVNFCADFLGSVPIECVYKNLAHIMDIGGEDVIALGSDFDGIPKCEGLEGCEKMQNLFEYLLKRKIPPRVLEKLATLNFMRVFEEVIG